MKIQANISKPNLDFSKVVKNVSTIASKITNYVGNQTVDINSASNVDNDLEIINLSSDIDLPESGTIFDPRNDENHNFGGNQGALINNLENFLQDENILEIVQSYYPNATEEDLEFLFTKMNNIGCGYVAAVNAIFLSFQSIPNGESKFEDIFGYSMLTYKQNSDGESYLGYRYEYMFLDFFLYYAKNERGFETIEDVYGDVVIGSSDAALDDRVEIDSGMSGTQLKDVARVLKEYLDDKGARDVLGNLTYEYDVQIEIFPGTDEWLEKKQEMEQLGITVNDDDILYGPPNADYFKEALNEGKIINIRDQSFKLYFPEDVDGNGVLDDVYREDIGPHAMTLVDVLDDGRFVVSSWGKMYIYDYDEDNIDFGFVSIDYE